MRGLKMFAVASMAVGALTVTVPAHADQSDHPGQPDHKVTICHGAVDHYDLITIDQHALVAHEPGAPDHGWQNLPDRWPNPDGTCGGGTDDGGGIGL